MSNSGGGIGGVGEGKRDGRRRRRRRQRQGQRRHTSPPPPADHPYEYIMIPGGGGHFDIPEGEDKEECIQFFEEAARATREGIARRGGNGRPADGINRAPMLPHCTHRDGSIYSVTGGWHKTYRISDTDETQLEAGAKSNPSNCYPNQEICCQHTPRAMMQIFSIELGKLSMDSGPVEIYGYIAIRDTRDPLRNYVFNRSRVDPITLEQGSPIEMIGPKRGIDMSAGVLIEFDMKIKKGGEELDDIQLIDGVTDFDELTTPAFKPFLSRIDGIGGAVDITLAMFHFAVEATIEVDIAQVYENGFHLVLTSSVSGLVVEKQIKLFDGVVGRPCGLGRFIVAVNIHNLMHLKFKFVDEGITNEVERCASFKAKSHGYDIQQLQYNEALIMVKVTWSTLSTK